MYISSIKVARITDSTLAQLEKVAPGIVELHGIKPIETAEAAIAVSSETLLPRLHPRESIGEVDVFDTSTGWIVNTEIQEFGR